MTCAGEVEVRIVVHQRLKQYLTSEWLMRKTSHKTVGDVHEALNRFAAVGLVVFDVPLCESLPWKQRQYWVQIAMLKCVEHWCQHGAQTNGKGIGSKMRSAT